MIDSPNGLTRKVVGTTGGVIRASSATAGVTGDFRRAIGVCRRNGRCCSKLHGIGGLIHSTHGIRRAVLVINSVASVCIADFRHVLDSPCFAPRRLDTVTLKCAGLLRRDTRLLGSLGAIIGRGKLSVGSGREVSVVSHYCGSVLRGHDLMRCCAGGGVKISCLHTGGRGSLSHIVTLCNSPGRHC